MPSAGDDLEQPELSYIPDGSVGWYDHFGKPRPYLLKLNTCVLYDPSVPLLGVYSQMWLSSPKDLYQNVQSNIIHNR